MFATVRERLRAYGAALVIGAAAIGAVPELRVATPPAIVRPSAMRSERFDPVEQIGGFVLTAPLSLETRSYAPARTCLGHAN